MVWHQHDCYNSCCSWKDETTGSLRTKSFNPRKKYDGNVQAARDDAIGSLDRTSARVSAPHGIRQIMVPFRSISHATNPFEIPAFQRSDEEGDLIAWRG